MNPSEQERIIILIDGSNFYHSVKSTFDVHDDVDIGANGFQELVKILQNNRLLIGTFYYNATLDRSHNEEIYWKQQKFFGELKRIPDFHVILCKLRKRREKSDPSKFRYAIKEDDIHIAVNMVSLAYENAYDTIILISGDGDFVPAIKKVQKLGKRVENAYFKISSSNYLKQVCNNSIRLDEIVENIIRKNSPASLRHKPHTRLEDI